MSPIKTDDLNRIFRNLDKNNNGIISTQQLHDFLNKIGIQTTSEEIEKLVGRKNLDYVDFLFFYEAMIKTRIVEQGDTDDDDLVKVFEVFDLNGDGFISREELEKVLSKMELWDKSSGKDCKKMIDVYDENFDGVLDFEEFKNMTYVNNSHDADDKEIM